MGQEREKKILVPNSILTQPELENSKKNRKKIQKTEKVNSGIISIQNGLREAEKEKKNFSPEFRSFSSRARKFRKKGQKI